jgi:hypothetical protein
VEAAGRQVGATLDGLLPIALVSTREHPACRPLDSEEDVGGRRSRHRQQLCLGRLVMEIFGITIVVMGAVAYVLLFAIKNSVLEINEEINKKLNK